MMLAASLYQQFDPARALEADENQLYVDWQNQLDADDVKGRLVQALRLSGSVPTCRLFTGHRGVGKTTELKRVKQRLEGGAPGAPRFFVSYLEAEDRLDLQDVAGPDVVLQIVRQLVDDLDALGIGLGKQKVQSFIGEFVELLNREVEFKEIKIPTSIVDLGLTLRDVPNVRGTLRKLLEGKLPRIYDLINQEVLVPARNELLKSGFQDIVVIVDQLDRIPQKVLNDHGLTNHENLFLDQSTVLRSLGCHVIYTVPIELAYSQSRPRLTATYGSEILSMPVIPITNRLSAANTAALDLLRGIVDRRAGRAKIRVDQVFASPGLLDQLCHFSGGHIRNLFVLLRSALERSESLPLTHVVVDKAVRRQATDIALGLGKADWIALREVHTTKQQIEDPERWHSLLKDLFVFSYEDRDGVWYDWNPLLEHAGGMTG